MRSKMEARERAVQFALQTAKPLTERDRVVVVRAAEDAVDNLLGQMVFGGIEGIRLEASG